ncbi:glycosyltransferase family 9 protein [Geotalea uraniireducens]|uniref:glycosyltransferase family 9 protein n=1 Tax=Geotalea uraniireducens TaxID=351604 RepID=UPI0024921AF7|nr:glycosyltransferase family 9 protein [Geotalea uraniireducens]
MNAQIIALVKKLDSLLGPSVVAFINRLPQKKIQGSRVSSILLIRPGGIGDAALLVPAINSLKQYNPDISITVLAERRNGLIFSLCPDVDQLFYYDRLNELLATVRGHYDIVIDTEQWHRLSAVIARITRAPISIGYATNKRQQLFTHRIAYSHDTYEVESFFHLLKPLIKMPLVGYETPFLFIPEDTDRYAGTLLAKNDKNLLITLFPGASIPERRWGAERFQNLAQRLHSRGAHVVVIGGKEDYSYGDRICTGGIGLNLAGRTSLVGSAAIINRSDLLISGDSGILHVAMGLNVPTVSLFGPGRVNKWAPRGENHLVINKSLSCSPCTTFGCTPRCPINARCMAEITVDEVECAVLELLSRKKSAAATKTLTSVQPAGI